MASWFPKWFQFVIKGMYISLQKSFRFRDLIVEML